MNAGVIDTSALVKFVIPEEHSGEASRLIELHQASRIRLIAPDYIMVESANVLWKHVRRNGLTVEDATAGINLLRRAGIRLVQYGELLDDAIRLAVGSNITIYDALFAALAQRESIPLITADRPLITRLTNTGVQSITLDAIPLQR